MALNLHLLRLFASVVEHDGFTAAARAVHVSQPAISRAVRDLEAQLGVPLLVRGGGRGVKLTAAGETLYGHARGVFASERAAEDALAALRGVERGRLRVGASFNIATYALPPVIEAFVARHPGVDLTLSALHTRDLAEMLVAFDLDVAIAETPVADARIDARHWRWDDMVVIAAPGHPLAGRRRVPPDALSRERFVLREPESATRDMVIAGLRAAGVVPERTMSVDTSEAIKQLVAAGCGIGVVSRAAVAEQVALRRIVVLDVAGLTIRRSFSQLLLRAHQPSTAAATFNAVLLEHADGPRVVGKNGGSVRSA
ncbi:MAG TPA: LysR family transcriptional regulator [Gemmatimonadaceae bacterium]|nr:LysR family transcriptional regulator [Gemmatimonadaceae bacterium]